MSDLFYDYVMIINT